MAIVGEGLVVIRAVSTAFDGDLAGAAAKMVKVLTVAGAAAAAGAIAGIATIGMAYEQSLNVFEAVSGANAAQMARVGAAAKALGGDMSLPATSAADAASAMTELAKAGLSVEESLAAAKGTLQLAAAAQVTEAQAAEISANALNAFGLAGSEAGRVADILAASANASSAEITDMADALKMSSAVAAAAGIPIEDLSSVLGELANKGIKGSDAGTSVKQMLLSLEGPSKKAAGTMAELGINIYDSSGKMISMRDIIANVGGAMKGLTDQQRNQALATIFGSDAVRAANIVLLGGVDAFDQMKEAVTRSGAAADVASAKTKGLKGAWEGMKSQLETVAISIYEKASPAVESFVRSAADGIPRAVEAVGQAARSFAAAFKAADGDITSSGFNGTMERLGYIASQVFPVVKDMFNDVVDAIQGGIALAKPIIDTLFDVFAPAVAALALGMVGLIDGLGALGRWFSENEGPTRVIGTIIATLLVPAIVSIGVTSAISAAQSVAAWVVMEAKAIAGAIAHGIQVALIVGGWILMGVTAVAQAAVIAAAWLISMGPIVLVVAAVVGLAIIVAKNWDTIKEAVAAGAEWIREHMLIVTAVLTAIAGPLGLLVGLFISHFDKIKGVVVDAVQAVVDNFLSMAELVTGLAAKAFGWVPGVGPKLRGAADAVANFRDEVNDYLNGIDGDVDVNVYYNSYHRDYYETVRNTDPGDYGGSMAAGGVIGRPTYDRAASGFRTRGPTLVGEGRQQFPEYVIPTDPAYRDRALALMSALGGEMGLSPSRSSPNLERAVLALTEAVERIAAMDTGGIHMHGISDPFTAARAALDEQQWKRAS